MTRLPVTTAAGLLIAAAFAGAQAPASQPSAPSAPGQGIAPPEVTFKVEVNYVEEDVRVVDRDGNPVRGLKQEDFQVLEDGKPQKIQTFGMVDIPLTRPRKPLFLEGTHYRSSRMLPSTSRCSTGGYT